MLRAVRSGAAGAPARASAALTPAGGSAKAAEHRHCTCAPIRTTCRSRTIAAKATRTRSPRRSRTISASKIEYTYFPQRMGFVRNTLRARDETDARVQVRPDHRRAEGLRAHRHDAALHALDLCAGRVPSGRTSKTSRAPDDLLSAAAGEAAEAAHRHLRAATGRRLAAAERADRSGAAVRGAERRSERDTRRASSSTTWRGQDRRGDGVGPVAGLLADRTRRQGWIAVPFKPDPRRSSSTTRSRWACASARKQWKDTLDQWIGSHRPQINPSSRATTFPCWILPRARPPQGHVNAQAAPVRVAMPVPACR